MTRGQIDVAAKSRALSRYGLPKCCLVPVAARSIAAVETYIGQVAPVSHHVAPDRALLVHAYGPPELNLRLPIWALKEAAILHRPRQVWVHVDYRRYREAYAEAFPDESIANIVLDHVLNRRMARATGFEYLRIVPISREANSCSGGLPEKWGVAHQTAPEMTRAIAQSAAFIQYADLGAS